MKSSKILAPIFLSLLALTGASSASAQAVIDTLDNGNLSVTGMRPRSGCTVLFNPQGKRLQNGRSCNSRDISEAQSAIDTYLREQGSPTHENSDSARRGLTLICYGEGRKPSVESRTGYEWSDRRHRFVRRDRIEASTADFDSEVQVEVRNQKGKIHLTGKLVPPIHAGGKDGWWNLDDLKITSDQITGRYRLNGLNKPRVTIDRRSGQIAIDGIERFRGICDSGDWNSRNRF
ncbi:hypothetical protein [Leptolyngbya sp. GGD]|uniref:hypothetical protein n=1 Tax=Leptolyngbya sp. GGD TaxID=2997907 RepID=UPI00227AA1B7|nr:hypothetical protein [Leptolyngbya sp. GGD]MCY6490471.1 hypothetical protein [Leptolyngbya sp. GGD]